MDSIIKNKAFFGVLGGLSILRLLHFVYYTITNDGSYAPADGLENLDRTFGLPSGVFQVIMTVVLLSLAGIAFAGIANKLRDAASTRILILLLGLNSFIVFLYILEILTPQIDYNLAIVSLPAFLFPLWIYVISFFYGEASVFFLFLTTLFQIFLIV